MSAATQGNQQVNDSGARRGLLAGLDPAAGRPLRVRVEQEREK
jgi:hypothetical protein